jgi:hypothetical protein
MHAFEQHVFDRLAAAIRQLPRQLVADIYVISFWPDADDQDLRYQTVRLGYNTRKNYASLATDDDGELTYWAEAKWHWELWEETDFAIIASKSAKLPDKKGIALRRVWLESQGLFYTDKQARNDPDGTERMAFRASDKFDEMVVRVARRFHEEGIIAARFGKPIPIIIHDEECSDASARLTRLANPRGLAREYLAFVKNPDA